MSTYHFSDLLDAQFLSDLYDGDIEYAQEMFSLFLSTTDEKMNNIHKDLSAKNYTHAHNTLHKLVPTFRMVGLTDIYEQATILLEHLETKEDVEIYEFHALTEKYNDRKQAVEDELSKINRVLISTGSKGIKP